MAVSRPRAGFLELTATKARGNNANVICPCCDTVLPGNAQNPRTSTQLAGQHGGADVVLDEAGNRVGGAFLLAVVTQRPGERGRRFRLATERDYKATQTAQSRLDAVLERWRESGQTELSPVPDEPTPAGGGSGAGRAFSVQRYGMLQWGDLFTARQKVVLDWLVKQIAAETSGDCAIALACALSRVAMSGMSCTRWNAVGEKMQHTFGRQALPIVWDFAEVVVTADAPGNWESGYALVAEVVEACRTYGDGQVALADAAESTLPHESADVWFTDPPYYDAVPYADLADFFFVWLKRVLPHHQLLHDPFDSANPLTPKTREAVQDETKRANGRPKDRVWFEETMAAAFAEGRQVLREDGIGCVVFAHKTTEGWEALLSGMIRGGWTITGSWPIATEMATRLRARESAALATSVHLICRPRPESADVGDWALVLRELPDRVADWMERLQGPRASVARTSCLPASVPLSKFSAGTPESRLLRAGRCRSPNTCRRSGRSSAAPRSPKSLGPPRPGLAMELPGRSRRMPGSLRFSFGRSKARTPRSRWPPAAEPADEDVADEDAAEDGAGRAGAKGYSLVFDVVRRFAQPLGIGLPEWEGRIIETKKGVVRLLPVAERTTAAFW